ncbi:MAG TPA: glycosyltransferase family 2 protein [Candidatus Thermoplasmatota archaeon]|nr:glycosyltransferase family 2 protein [Candidatus Thermoplasmatota archaeon]
MTALSSFDPTVERGFVSRPPVTILLPAKNEETGIEATFAALPVGRLRDLGYPVEILVADGRSHDRTRDVATAHGARVIQQLGTGKGRGVRSALDVAKGEYVVMLDADSTYPARAIPAFVSLLDEGFDVVMGSRFLGRIDAGAMKRINRVGNHGLSWLATALYGRRCTDLCTGMWAFRRDLVRGLGLTSTGFEIEAEMFARSARAGLRMIEVPIAYAQREGVTKLGSVGDGVKIAMALLKYRFGR